MRFSLGLPEIQYPRNYGKTSLPPLDFSFGAEFIGASPIFFPSAVQNNTYQHSNQDQAYPTKDKICYDGEPCKTSAEGFIARVRKKVKRLIEGLLSGTIAKFVRVLIEIEDRA